MTASPTRQGWVKAKAPLLTSPTRSRFDSAIDGLAERLSANAHVPIGLEQNGKIGSRYYVGIESIPA